MLRAQILRIGNSLAIRIPKRLLQQAGLKDRVILRAENGRLLVVPNDELRAGWAEAFAKATQAPINDLDRPGSLPNGFDRWEWTW